jgi:hypothetical protein
MDDGRLSDMAWRGSTLLGIVGRCWTLSGLAERCWNKDIYPFLLLVTCNLKLATSASFYSSTFFLSFSPNVSTENSRARATQSSFILKERGKSSTLTASQIDPGVTSLSIRMPVFSGRIVSRSHPSSTPITGTPQAIDSIGLMPKSSSRGI